MLSNDPGNFRYFVELAFNGSCFHGWQIQPGAITVQEVLNKAISTLLAEPVNLVGCGRTDAGVHAAHFVAHFDVQKPVTDCDQLVYRINRFINLPIRVDRIVYVNQTAHARFDAQLRTYHYLISSEKSPFMRDFTWQIPFALDVESMNKACSLLLGKHDFTSFSKLHTDVKTNICTVTTAHWMQNDHLLVFKIQSDRFLRNMVRAIVGTMIEIGKHKMDYTEMKSILLALDRSSAGMSVPAQGLFLSWVDYPGEIFKTKPATPFINWERFV